MMFNDIKKEVLNRGRIPDYFAIEMVDWCRTAPDEIFLPNPSTMEIYPYVKPELGPWLSLLHRKAVMLEVMRVLALFESSCDWEDGVDTSRLGDDTPENAEAGAWQVSYSARRNGEELRSLLIHHGIENGIAFQEQMKEDHKLAMEFIARLMRITRMHNGPLYKGKERAAIRKTLRGPEQSIYPWLSRAAVNEWKVLLE